MKKRSVIEKKGLGHVETILSFVLFIGFLIFAFFFFDPFSSNRVVDSSSDYAFSEIEKYAGVDFDSYSIVIKPGVTSPIVGVSIDSDIEAANARAEDSSGAALSNVRIEGTPENYRVYFSKAGDNFALVKVSSAYPVGTGSGGVLLAEGNYTISSSEEGKIYSEGKIIELKSEYESDYAALKKDFNLPGRVDFGFRIEFDDGTQIFAENSVPEGVDIFSESKRIEIIRNTGNTEFANLIVHIW